MYMAFQRGDSGVKLDRDTRNRGGEEHTGLYLLDHERRHQTVKVLSLPPSCISATYKAKALT